MRLAVEGEQISVPDMILKQATVHLRRADGVGAFFERFRVEDMGECVPPAFGLYARQRVLVARRDSAYRYVHL